MIKLINSIDNVKLSDLPEITSRLLSKNDLFYVVDDGISKKLTYSNLVASLNLIDLPYEIKKLIDKSLPDDPSDDRVPSTKLLKSELNKLSVDYNRKITNLTNGFLTVETTISNDDYVLIHKGGNYRRIKLSDLKRALL